MDHLARPYWAHGDSAERVAGADPGVSAPFPRVNGTVIRVPPHANEPRGRIFLDGSEEKWCVLCGN